MTNEIDMRGPQLVKAFAFVVCAVCLFATAASSAQSITFAADDTVVIHGTYTPAVTPKALILLFHQAGSSKDEYATIAPRLATAGYASLAIDQRVGGSMFGRNETAAGLRTTASYADAEGDLTAALIWATSKQLPIVLWGSSYSAALVFLVAAKHPDQIAAVMAFSPGEYLGGGSPVHAAAAHVSVPIFITSAQDASEIAAARSILRDAPASRKTQFIPTHGGIHGSSTLIESRNRAGSSAVWQAVMAFLQGLSS